MAVRRKFYTAVSCVIAVLFATAALAVVDVGKMKAKPAVVAEATPDTSPAVVFTVAGADVATPAQVAVTKVVLVPVTAATVTAKAGQITYAVFGANRLQERWQFSGA